MSNATPVLLQRPAPENTVLFVIGLDEKRQFSVDSAAAPSRVVHIT